MQSSIPDDVRNFIHRHITSVEQVDILLLLRETASRWWSAPEVARSLRGNPDSVGRRLEQLRANSFVVSGPHGYRYGPATDRLARDVAELADVYARRRHTVITTIFSDHDGPAPA